MVEVKEDYLLTDEVRKEARRAYKKGTKTITVNGRKFNLVRGSGKAKHYLCLSPSDGSHVPVAQIEIAEYSGTKLPHVRDWAAERGKKKNK